MSVQLCLDIADQPATLEMSIEVKILAFECTPVGKLARSPFVIAAAFAFSNCSINYVISEGVS